MYEAAPAAEPGGMIHPFASRGRALADSLMATILLIGASRGIGFELSLQYREAGWRVIATARSAEGLDRLQALGCETLRVDVAQPAGNSGLAATRW